MSSLSLTASSDLSGGAPVNFIVININTPESQAAFCPPDKESKTAKKVQSSRGMHSISPDERRNVAFYLLFTDIINLRIASPNFRGLATDDQFWRRMVARDYALDSKLRLHSHSVQRPPKDYYEERVRFRINLGQGNYKEITSNPLNHDIKIESAGAFDIDETKFAYCGYLSKTVYRIHKPSSWHIIVKDKNSARETLIPINNQKINCLKLLGDLVIAGSLHGELVIANIETKALRIIPVPSATSISALVIYGDYLISGSISGNIEVWSLADFSHCGSIKGCRGELHSLVLKGNFLICGSEEGVSVWKLVNDEGINAWDLANTDDPHHFPAVGTSITCLNWDSNLLYGGGLDGKIRVWNPITENLVKVMKVHSDAVNSIQLIERMMISSGSDNCINVFSLSENEHLASYNVTKLPAIQIKLDATRIACFTHNKSGLTFFDFKSPTSPKPLEKVKHILGDSRAVRTRRTYKAGLICLICVIFATAFTLIHYSYDDS